MGKDGGKVLHSGELPPLRPLPARQELPKVVSGLHSPTAHVDVLNTIARDRYSVDLAGAGNGRVSAGVAGSRITHSLSAPRTSGDNAGGTGEDAGGCADAARGHAGTAAR